MIDERSTAEDLRAEQPEIAVFGIGAIEQHGPHLPVSTDWSTVTALSRRVAAVLDALWVPALPFSMSQCHGPMAGTVWLKPDTLAAVLRDVVLSMYEQGIRKVLILNGHGGNFVLEAVIQELNLAYPDLLVVMPIEVWLAPGGAELFETAELHAGEVETSNQLNLNPDDVKLERAVDNVPPVGREFLDYAFMYKISHQGVWGQPTYATQEKGERAMAAQVEFLSEWAQTTFAELEAVRTDGQGRA